MSRQETIPIIKNYFKGTPVSRAYLFGSFSRAAEKYNDIDILIEISKNERVSLLDLVSYKNDLEDKIKEPVDIVPERALNERIKLYIDKDKILIYER